MEKKIRGTVKAKKEESEEIFRTSTRMVQMEMTRVVIRKKKKKTKTRSHTFIQNHAIYGLFPGHRFWVDLRVFRMSWPQFEPRPRAVESPALGTAAPPPPRVNNFISLCFFCLGFTH